MMRTLLVAACLLGAVCILFFSWGSPFGSRPPLEVKEVVEDSAAAEAVLERAIAAHGGGGLKRLRNVRVRYRVKGEFPLPDGGDDVDARVTELCAIPRGMRKEVDGTANGRPYRLTWIAGPNGTWMRQGRGEPTASRRPADVYPQFRAYLPLESLLDHTPGEWLPTRDGGEEGLIAVRHRGEQGKTYSFDRQTGRLAKTMTRRDPDVQTRFDDYRTVAGLSLYHRMTGLRGGRMVFELTVEQVELLAEVDPKEFSLPPSKAPGR